MNIEGIQNRIVQVENYQATFLILELNDQLFRFDFIDKKEFNLKKGTRGPLRIYQTHPLLIDHNENIVTTYINSKPDNFISFIRDFENAINEITEGWRKWTNYVQDRNINFTVNIFLNNVKKGTGKLLEAPFSITQKVIEICNQYNVSVKTFGSELKLDNFKLILIDDNYVIAREFRHHIY